MFCSIVKHFSWIFTFWKQFKIKKNSVYSFQGSIKLYAKYTNARLGDQFYLETLIILSFENLIRIFFQGTFYTCSIYLGTCMAELIKPSSQASKKDGKNQETIQTSATPDTGYHMRTEVVLIQIINRIILLIQKKIAHLNAHFHQ